MKFIIWILAMALLPLLIAGSVMLGLRQTYLSSQYMKTELARTNIYTDLAEYLPGQIIDGLELKAKDKSTALNKVNQIITPQYLKTKIENLFDQGEAALDGKGSAIQLDFSDALDQLKAQGIEIPQEMVQPINYQLNQAKTEAGQSKPESFLGSARSGRNAIYYAIAFNLILLTVLSVWKKSYGGLIFAFAIAGLADLGLLYIARLTPGLIKNYMPTDQPILEKFMPTIDSIITSANGKIVSTLGISGVVLIVLAVGVLIASQILKGRSPEVAKPVEPTKIEN